MSFSANPNDVKIPESEGREYTKLYARPGAMKAALGYFKAFPTDAVQNQAFLAKGKLTMPVLTIEGERGVGGALKVQAAEVADTCIPTCFRVPGIGSCPSVWVRSRNI